MNATSSPTTTSPAPTPGPLTLALARLGRVLGMNVRAAVHGDDIALVLDDDAVVMTKNKTREGAIGNAVTFLNKLSAAVEQRVRPQQAPHASLTKKLPEAKVPVGPTVRRLG